MKTIEFYKALAKSREKGEMKNRDTALLIMRYQTSIPATKPDSPFGVGVTAKDGAVDINWSAVTGATDGYRIFTRNTNGTYTLYRSVAAGVLSQTLSPLVNGTTYTFAVAAVAGGVESDKTNAPAVTPKAGAVSEPTHFSGDYVKSVRLVDKNYTDANISYVAKQLKKSLKTSFKNGWSDNPITGTPSTLNGAKDMYGYRFSLVHVYTLIACFEETGDPVYLDWLDEILYDRLVAGIATAWVRWPTNAPWKDTESNINTRPSDKYDNPYGTGTNPNGYPYNFIFTSTEWGKDGSGTHPVGYNIWPNKDSRSKKWFDNRNNPGAPELVGRKRIIYYANNKPGDWRQPGGMVDYGHDLNFFDIEICYALISTVAMYLYLNKDRRVTGNRDWGATAQMAYDLLEDVFYIFSQRTDVSGRRQGRHPTLKYFDEWQDITHGGWSQVLLLATHYEHKRARTGAGNPDDKTGCKKWFGYMLSKLRTSPVGETFATFSVPIANPTNYQFLNWNHNPGDAKGHASNYLAYVGPMWVLCNYWGITDESNNTLGVNRLKAGANTVGMLWTGKGNTNLKVTTSVGKYVKANTGTDKSTYPYINSSVDGKEFKSPYIGGSKFTSGNYGTNVGGIMVAFDPTPEKANITVLARKVTSNAYDLDAVVADPTANTRSRKEQGENYTWLYIALKNKDFTTWKI